MTAAVSLSIVDEAAASGAVKWQLWPHAQPVPPGAVAEARSYLFLLENHPDAAEAELEVDGVALEALRARAAGQARWRWQPGFHAGSVDIRLRIGRRRTLADLSLTTDPDLRKLTRDRFDTMVREILEDTLALFSLTSFRSGVARGSGTRRPPLARLELIRSRMPEIEASVRAIADAPRRRLGAVTERVPLHRAGRVTSQEVLASMRGANVARSHPDAGLPAPLRGFVPRTITSRRRQESLDSDEHQRIGALLRSWREWLAAVAVLLDRDRLAERDPERRSQEQIWAARCLDMARRLGNLAELPPFRDCTPVPPRIEATAVFRNVPPYRRFLAVARDMDAGLAQVFGDFLEMPLARTFELYELWCFLRLVRAAAAEFGGAAVDPAGLFASQAGGRLTLTAGAVRIPLGSGVELCFQREYREFWLSTDRCGSFSRTLRPDVSLHCRAQPEGATSIVVLDAKYRVEAALNDALSSIHAYRDALLAEDAAGSTRTAVKAAYLLAPALPQAAMAASYQATPMPARLFHPQYRGTFRFGAVQLAPGMSLNDVRSVLLMLIADAGHAASGAPGSAGGSPAA
jgi:hypothetical protein